MRKNHHPFRAKKTIAPLSQYPGDFIKQALLPYDPLVDSLEELIATSEAAFAFIRCAEIDRDIRNAFGQLEKQFEFYKRLLDG